MILSYGRISSINKFIYPVWSIELTSKEKFLEQLDFVNKGGIKDGEGSVEYTFDAPYPEVIEWAIPLILSCGLKCKLFMNSTLVDQDGVSWWDQVAYILINLFDINYPIHEIDKVFEGLLVEGGNPNQIIFESTQRLFAIDWRLRKEILDKLFNNANFQGIEPPDAGNLSP